MNKVPKRAIRKIIPPVEGIDKSIYYVVCKSVVDFCERNNIPLTLNGHTYKSDLYIFKVIPSESVSILIDNFQRKTQQILDAEKYNWRRKVRKSKEELSNHLDAIEEERIDELEKIIFEHSPFMIEMTKDQYTMMLLTI